MSMIGQKPEVKCHCVGGTRRVGTEAGKGRPGTTGSCVLSEGI